MGKNISAVQARLSLSKLVLHSLLVRRKRVPSTRKNRFPLDTRPTKDLCSAVTIPWVPCVEQLSRPVLWLPVPKTTPAWCFGERSPVLCPGPYWERSTGNDGPRSGQLGRIGLGRDQIQWR